MGPGGAIRRPVKKSIQARTDSDVGQGRGREKNADSRDTLKLLPVEFADIGRGIQEARMVVA